MVKGTERRTERFTIRLPESLRNAIERAAERDRRSVSDWIVLTLEDAVQRPKEGTHDVAAILRVPGKRSRRANTK